MSNTIIDRLDELKVQLDALRPMKSEREHELWEKLRLEWNFNSNHLEGNTLTYGDTVLLFLKKIMPSGGYTEREIFEMKAHNVAISMVKEWAEESDRPLREGDIRDLNQVLLKEPFYKEAITADGLGTQVEVVPGQYKKHGNLVRQPDGTLFEYAKPEDVAAKMQELIEWYHQEVELHPIQKAAVLHHRFVLIHPFGDGNGRTARLLANYHLMRHGYMPLVIKSEDKARYLVRLKQADAGDLGPFIEYMAEQAEWTMKLAIRAAQDLSVEEPADWRKEAELLLRNTTDVKQKAESREQRWRTRIADSIELNYPLIKLEIEEKLFFFKKFFKVTDGTVAPSFKVDKSYRVHPTKIARTEAPQLMGVFRNQDTTRMLQFEITFTTNVVPIAKSHLRILFTWTFNEEDQTLSAKLPNELPPLTWPYGVSLHEMGTDFFDQIGKTVLQKIQPA